MMLKKTITALAAFAFAFGANADEGFKISGDFAVSNYYESGSGRNGDHNAFNFDLTEIALEKAMGNSRIYISLGYGDVFEGVNNLIDVANGAGSKSSANIANAYFAHNLDNGLSFRVGRFQSFLGFEDYHLQDNMNYSLSYGYSSMTPKFHTGLEVSYNFNDMVDLAGYVVNSAVNTDRDEDNGDTKYYGLSASFTGVENLTLKANYLMGRMGALGTNVSGFGGTDAFTSAALTLNEALEDTTMELMAEYSMDNMSFGVDYMQRALKGLNNSAVDADATSLAIYAGYSMEKMGASLRYEMVTDDNGIVSGAADNSLSAFTLTGYYEADTNVKLVAEIRQDSSDKKVFQDEDGQAEDSMMRYGLGAMYKF